MPHPPTVEQAAEQVAAIGDQVDAAIEAHIVDGAPLPRPGVIVDRIRPQIMAAVAAAFDDITPGGGNDLTVAAAAEEILDEIAAAVRRGLRDGADRRQRVEQAPDPADDDDGGMSIAALLASGAAFGTVLGVQARSGRGTPRRVLQRLAAQTREPLPMRLGPMMRQRVRTQIAVARNRFAANLADAGRRLGLDVVIRVEDGRYGPTDTECEDVDGEYATAAWLRSHPVEHPNCTRRGRPAVLPVDRYVTLLE